LLFFFNIKRALYVYFSILHDKSGFFVFIKEHNIYIFLLLCPT